VRIAFLGLGQIGGSVARAIRERGVDVELAAWSPAGVGPRRARDAGIIDERAEDARDAVRGSDLVVLAGPADVVVGLVARFGSGDLRGLLPDGATVTDVASTKVAVVGEADRHTLPFVGGHPMAGSEGQGFEASDGRLFVGRPWLIVPGASARATDVARVEWLARSVGATPIEVTAGEHDAAVAAVSHGPLVLAAALAEAIAARPGWPESLERTLAAGGWASMTRLARGDPAMGAGMLATNAAETAAAVRAVRAVLDEWIARLDAGASADELARRLAGVRELLDP
jgi:prephenate dehydrogenase